MITDKDGNIVGVPGYTGYLAFWVNQEIMDEVGIESIDTKEDFMKYMEAVSKDGRFGYGGSWEKTYASNEIAQFVNMVTTSTGQKKKIKKQFSSFMIWLPTKKHLLIRSQINMIR